MLLALHKLGLKPDPTEGELLDARGSGKPPPCGDAARGNVLFRQISSVVWERRILIRFERKPRPKDVAAELRRLAKACRSSARALRSLSKSDNVLIFHDLNLGDRFARAERFDDPPESLSRRRMIQAAGVEQELASVIASLAREAAWKASVTQDESLRWLEADASIGDAPLMTFAKTQERLGHAWCYLSLPAMEHLFDAKPLWAIFRLTEKLESKPIFWKALGPPPAGADVELIRRWLLEKTLAVAAHADAKRRAFQAAWPLKEDKGGVSPLVGSANSRLSAALLRALGDTLPESYDRISSYPGGAYDSLLQAVAEMASGEKPKNRAFANVLEKLPTSPARKARREQIVEQKREEGERRKTEREKADIARELKQLREAPDEFERRRQLSAAFNRDPSRAERLLTAFNDGAEQPPPKTWVQPLRPSGAADPPFI